MSDIGLEFPLWVSLAFLGLQYWYAIGPAGLALAGVGLFGRGLPMALRYAAWGAAVVCAAPFALVLVMIAADALRASGALGGREFSRTLASDETVGTLALPAGAVLAFTDETHSTLRSVSLPRPTPIAGILLEGSIEPIDSREWAGFLARDQVIGDWPCGAGAVWFTPDGAATRCTLAAGHRLAGYDLPAGAACRHDPGTGGWEFLLSPDGPPLRIATLGADVPPSGSLELTAAGALRRLYVPHEARMVVAGIALYDHIIIEGTGLTAELAEPTLVAGTTLPAGAVVRLDPATGKVEATTRSSTLDP